MKINRFQGWPEQALAQIMFTNEQPGFDVCQEYWVLTKTSILLGSVGLAGDQSRTKPEVDTIHDPAAAHAFQARPRISGCCPALAINSQAAWGR